MTSLDALKLPIGMGVGFAGKDLDAARAQQSPPGEIPTKQAQLQRMRSRDAFKSMRRLEARHQFSLA